MTGRQTRKQVGTGLLEARQNKEEIDRLIAEREWLENKLRQSEAKYRSLVERSAEGIWRMELTPPVSTSLPADEQIKLFYERAHIVEGNQAMAQMYGLASADDLLGVTLGQLLVPTNEKNTVLLRDFIRSGYQLTDAESYDRDVHGNDKYYRNNLAGDLSHDGSFLTGTWGTQRDITEQKRAQGIGQGQQQILEMIARGASSDDVLDALVTFIESKSRGSACSVLLLSKDQHTLHHHRAPHLATAFVGAINGLSVAEGSGVCGTAAYRKAMVIVADVMRDPLCAPFRDLADEHDIRACWSTPIFSKTGTVLGTFAMYFAAVREPAAAPNGSSRTVSRRSMIAKAVSSASSWCFVMRPKSASARKNYSRRASSSRSACLPAASPMISITS